MIKPFGGNDADKIKADYLSFEKEITDLKDKLHRRNMQIKEMYRDLLNTSLSEVNWQKIASEVNWQKIAESLLND